MGHNEAVTPVFPNSDYCTGICGSTAVLDALIQRSSIGGSYGVDCSLNYYSQWLARTVGTYPAPIWQDLWERNGSPVFRHYHAMSYTIPKMLELVRTNSEETVFKKEFFEQREAKNLKTTFVAVKPVAQFPGGEVELRYNVGTRGNGVDQPRWPKDLSVQIVDETN
jgi:hypothetical protein